MKVVEIIPLDRRRSKVVLDEDFAFALYNGEIKKSHIVKDGELTKEAYQDILDGILLKRALERSFCLLKISDKTEQELRRKLKDGYYPAEAIDYAVNYLKKNGYMDDDEYGRRYVECHSSKKSKRQIQYELRSKGLSAEAISNLLEETPIDEEAQIRNYIKKKKLVPGAMTPKERGKVMASLGRKGFSYEMVSRIFGDSYEDDGTF